MLNEFSRTQLLLGPEAMEKLAHSRVAVFGIGGVGGYTVEALARSGIGALDLIDSARAHGVRLVACQMSMDIMGIKKEELTDGVELGGVSTFLGSGEQSDMSLFI